MPSVYTTCKIEANFLLKGKLYKQDPLSYECKNDSKCAILIGNIPDLFLGSYSYCSNELLQFVGNLETYRVDLYDSLNKINFVKTAKNAIINNSYLLSNGVVYSGNYTLYMSFGMDANSISLQNHYGLTTLCTEGFCAYLKYSINDTQYQRTQKRTVSDCPTEFYNALYITENGYDESLHSPLMKIGMSCNNYDKIKLNNFICAYQYFFYQSCNINDSIVQADIPPFPQGIINEPKNIICSYNSKGYFSLPYFNLTNLNVNCTSDHCLKLDVNIFNISGQFQGCSSDLEVYLLDIVININTTIPIKIMIDYCKNNSYIKETIPNIGTITVSCGNGRLLQNHQTMTKSSSKINILNSIMILFSLKFIFTFFIT
uniref:Transmembrane protein n=1 Tax=Parastrongyloides trichosuri TaxID=131310 RepID=A0A0N4Z9V1_PARTI